MTETKAFHGSKMTTGDVAVSGLLNGIIAGAAMTAYLIVALGIGGESPMAVLQRFGPEGGSTTPLIGAVSHAAMSGIYGIVFALLWHGLGRRFPGWAPAMLGGLLYGGFLFALAQFVLLPAGGSPMLEVPVDFGISHVVYGLVLGYLARAKV